MLYECHIVIIILVFCAYPTKGQETLRWDYPEFPSTCLSIEQQSNIISSLKRKHRETRTLKEYKSHSRTTTFAFPLKYSDDVTDPGDFVFSNFVDHDSIYSTYSNINVLDYNCGNRSYDFELGNHQGTDIFAWPFFWKRMAHDEVEVVAAAEGMIIDKTDGNFDRNCEFCLSCGWNAVYLQHPDGTVTWYGHLKAYSLTEKNTGEIVQKGEYLGVVGSSGISTGPHLHFQVWETNNYLHVIDPFKGDCNPKNDLVSWDQQHPYFSPSVSYVTVGHVSPKAFECAIQQTPNIAYDFEAGNEIVYTAYFRDAIPGEKTSYTIYDPIGEVFEEWSRSFTGSFLVNWRTHKRILPKGMKQGEYSFEARYGDQLKKTTFFVTNPLENHPTGRMFFVYYDHQNKEGVVRCSVDAIGECNLKLYDMGGRLLLNAEFEYTIIIPHLSAGVYVIAVSDKNGSFDSQKLVVL